MTDLADVDTSPDEEAPVAAPMAGASVPRRRIGWRLSWIAMALVLVGALAIGTFGGQGERTAAERAHAIAETIKCPTCRSVSAAESDAEAAQFIRQEIARRIAAGQSDAEIRDYFASRYGEQILLTPSRSGLASLVWVLPVVALVVAGAGLVVAFRRWKRWA